jgi:glycosyltransferase involved in cell wall biosynthesis
VKKKIPIVLYLSYDGLGSHIGQAQILPYLLKCHEKGIHFHVVTFEKDTQDDLVQNIHRKLNDFGIRWYRLKYTVGNNIFFKLYDFMRFATTVLVITSLNRYVVIHGRSYIASSVALLSNLIFGTALIFDKRDFWVDAVVDSGRLNPSKLSHKLIYQALRFFETRLFLHSSHIVSLTETAKRIVLQKFPTRSSDEISVIPCCVDLSLFSSDNLDSSTVENQKVALGLNTSLVLGYVGSIGSAYKTNDLLNFFKIIKKRIHDAKLLFIVNNGEDEINFLVDLIGIPRSSIVIISSNRKNMPLNISLFDYGIYFITPTFAKQASSPTKLAEILAMNRPVITNKGVGDVDDIFEELQCGYLISEFSDNEYEGAAEWLQMNNLVKKTFNLERYSLAYGANQYFNIYMRFISA